MTSLVDSDFRSAAGFIALKSLPKVGAVTALRATLHSTQMAQLLERYGEEVERAFDRAQKSVADYADANVHLVSFFDDHYPDRLRTLSDPPPLLYVRGDVELLAREKLVAVVGTREPTVFGVSAAENLTAELAGGGWGIVNGLAKGIDTVAHRSAVEHGAPTIAVMGGGLDRIYPAENKALAARIADGGGALVSEQPFGEQPRPQHLIMRDRIQSGLSVAVLVAQCGVASGTMHTARFAAIQGRPLFCPVPHNENGASEGLRVLLERPARELCSLLPAWRSAKGLCARLGDQPLARPVSREGVHAFVRDVDLALEWPELSRDQKTLIPRLSAWDSTHTEGAGSV
jgi:DNA processing protein